MEYSENISLIENSRGCLALDSIMGCAPGAANTKWGCYGECYAFSAAKRYGYDFSKSVLRGWESNEHRIETILAINESSMPFVRLGVNGDPSINWDHTLGIIKDIKLCKKAIVIVTKHWNILSDIQLEELSKIGVVFNTSISALDGDKLIERRLSQYKRIKFYAKSILRVVTCRFNTDLDVGLHLDNIQKSLLSNDDVIETILRASTSNDLVKNGTIFAENTKFLDKDVYASVNNSDVYFGHCLRCPDMCGSTGVNRDNQESLF